jgi:2-polyprenyl-3-methyl-5-hydroxy-6-metoxy-1,4-benzoquinol methylase
VDQRDLLSIIVPVFNEEEFLRVAITRALEAPLPGGLRSEIVAIDDGSTDSSGAILEELAAEFPGRMRVLHHPRNLGKGAAIRTGIQEAAGQFGIIQDADLEYDPADYLQVLAPLVANQADVVYGSRFLISGQRRVLYYWHSLANRLITTACNMAADLNLTDIETCYKAFRMSLARGIPIRSNRFGIEPEITIKFAQRQAAIYEVPISYHGRTYEEGKKIGAQDALNALWVILRFAVIRDVYTDPGAAILDSLGRTSHFNRWMAETIRPFLGKRVLELGAGIGNITQHLARGRKLYAATDVDPEHLARLRVRFRNRPGIRIGACDLRHSADFAALGETFDTVVCLNVLEHVENDLLGLENIRSALEPGGRAVILVPQDESVYGSLDKVLGHWRRYSTAGLQTRMEQAGFHVEQVFEFNRISRPGWYIGGRLLKRETLGAFPLRLFDLLVPVWKRIDRALPWPAVSIIAVGVKAEGSKPNPTSERGR